MRSVLVQRLGPGLNETNYCKSLKVNVILQLATDSQFIFL